MDQSKIIVSLFFDPATEQAVRDLWRTIADAGVAVAGIEGYRPHVTLAAYDSSDVAWYCAQVRTFAASRGPIPIRFHNIGVFPEAGVVFLAPRVTGELLALHRALLRHFEGPNHPPVRSEHILGVDRWTPHCTLVADIPLEVVVSAVSVCQREWRAIEGVAAGIGLLVKPSTPEVDVCVYRFGRREWDGATQAQPTVTPE